MTTISKLEVFPQIFTSVVFYNTNRQLLSFDIVFKWDIEFFFVLCVKNSWKFGSIPFFGGPPPSFFPSITSTQLRPPSGEKVILSIFEYSLYYREFNFWGRRGRPAPFLSSRRYRSRSSTISNHVLYRQNILTPEGLGVTEGGREWTPSTLPVRKGGGSPTKLHPCKCEFWIQEENVFFPLLGCLKMYKYIIP